LRDTLATVNKPLTIVLDPLGAGENPRPNKQLGPGNRDLGR
jgi:hypothetical protein